MIVELEGINAISSELWAVNLIKPLSHLDGERLGFVDIKGSFYFVYGISGATYTMGEHIKYEVYEREYGEFELTEETLSKATVWIDMTTNSQIELSINNEFQPK